MFASVGAKTIFIDQRNIYHHLPFVEVLAIFLIVPINMVNYQRQRAAHTAPPASELIKYTIQTVTTSGFNSDTDISPNTDIN